ncbi:MAG: oxygenase MpaB family protein [Acidimicrobiia bacterium]
MPLYGPETVTWRVNQEAVLLLGGPRALLLQLAEPAVAAGVAEHSGFEADPFGRLARTLEAMTVISFGSEAHARSTLDRLAAVHARVRGTLPDGLAYSAEDPELQWWVLATLIDTVLRVERRYLGRLGPAERARYYDESRRMAAAFGIPDDVVPADLAAFLDYMRRRVAALDVTDTARALARGVLRPPVPLVGGPLGDLVGLITVDLLPARLRSAYGLAWDSRRRVVVRGGQAALRRVLPRLPAPLRTLPGMRPA